MSKVMSLFSSSSGNSFLISSNGCNILIDAGVCCKNIVDKLECFGIEPRKISAVIITHEHIDHVKGVKVFSDKFSVPVFASNGTITQLDNRNLLPVKSQIHTINGEFNVGDFKIIPFPTPHDCNESFGYSVFDSVGKKISVCTDLGHITPVVKDAILGSDFILIESNHDVDMLMNGNYPSVLKQRVLGMFGHLSNKACDDVLMPLIESGTTQIMLGHISKENNSVALALSCARKTLSNEGLKENIDYMISAADVDGNGKFCVV